jgi:nicotinamide-nucleotide amidase
MVREKVLPLIRQYKEVTPRPHRQLRVASLAESAVDHEVRPLYESYRDIRATILSSPGVIDLLLSWTGEPLADLANQQLDSLVSDIHRQLGVAVFTDRPEGLEAVTGELLQKKGLNLATAESCTGGLVGKLLTDVSGSSSYYLGGVVSYSNRLKESLLEVKRDALEKFGAVSEPVARQMAAGVCRLTGADLGLSVTGIAGPGGGSREKPVGLICFGLCLGGVTESREILLPGDRDVIRLRSARFAIDWVRRRVLQG